MGNDGKKCDCDDSGHTVGRTLVVMMIVQDDVEGQKDSCIGSV